MFVCIIFQGLNLLILQSLFTSLTWQSTTLVTKSTSYIIVVIPEVSMEFGYFVFTLLGILKRSTSLWIDILEKLFFEFIQNFFHLKEESLTWNLVCHFLDWSNSLEKYLSKTFLLFFLLFKKRHWYQFFLGHPVYPYIFQIFFERFPNFLFIKQWDSMIMTDTLLHGTVEWRVNQYYWIFQ